MRGDDFAHHLTRSFLSLKEVQTSRVVVRKRFDPKHGVQADEVRPLCIVRYDFTQHGQRLLARKRLPPADLQTASDRLLIPAISLLKQRDQQPVLAAEVV